MSKTSFYLLIYAIGPLPKDAQSTEIGKYGGSLALGQSFSKIPVKVVQFFESPFLTGTSKYVPDTVVYGKTNKQQLTKS